MDTNEEIICFICLDKTVAFNTKFIKEFLNIPCNCGWSSHLECYEEWAKTTDMICPYCRLRDDSDYDDSDDEEWDMRLQQRHLAQQQPQPQQQQQFHQLNPVNPAIIEIVNRNRLQMIFMIRCVDVVGGLIGVLILYTIFCVMFFALKKSFFVKNYNPLHPIEFY